MKMRLEEILDDDHELVIERVCAIDVAKASGKVCVRVPQPSRRGRRISRVWDVAATTGAVTELADHPVGAGIEKVTVESTSAPRGCRDDCAVPAPQRVVRILANGVPSHADGVGHDSHPIALRIFRRGNYASQRDAAVPAST
jgi:hypothetical protein